MIGWLRGLVVDKHQPGKLVLDVKGVGYDVETSLPTFFAIPEGNVEVAIHIHTIVREDALLLYGFLEQQERALFRALIKVNGIGPKSAMGILSSISPNEFVHCIQSQSIDVLMKLPGIGKKTAERLAVEMKDSLQQWLPSTSITPIASRPTSHRDEAISALEALGYKNQEAMKAMNKVDDGEKSCEVLIKEALQVLAGR